MCLLEKDESDGGNERSDESEQDDAEWMCCHKSAPSETVGNLIVPFLI